MVELSRLERGNLMDRLTAEVGVEAVLVHRVCAVGDEAAFVSIGLCPILCRRRNDVFLFLKWGGAWRDRGQGAFRRDRELRVESRLERCIRG